MKRRNTDLLSDLEPGETGRIVSRSNDSAIMERLGDLGIKQGSIVVCERVGFMGDPKAYRFRGRTQIPDTAAGTVIAIRRHDAASIRIGSLASEDAAVWD